MELKDHFKWGNWNNCVYLSNGIVDLVATTDIGPRIMRFGYQHKNNVFLEIDSQIGKTGGNDYRLYGGTRIWHSPEDSTRSYYPDNFPVKYDCNRNILRLLQDVESSTGMQKEILLKLEERSNKVEVVYKIYNKNLWPIKYALWALTLMAKNGRAVIPQEPFESWDQNLLPTRPIVLWSYTRMNDPRWIWGDRFMQLKQNPKSEGPTKIGTLNKREWIAYINNGYVFIKRFRYFENEEYPDYQSNIEVYSDPELFELETLSPLKTVMPGNYFEHKENWYLFKADISEDEEAIKKKLLPLIDETEIP